MGPTWGEVIGWTIGALCFVGDVILFILFTRTRSEHRHDVQSILKNAGSAQKNVALAEAALLRHKGSVARKHIAKAEANARAILRICQSPAKQLRPLSERVVSFCHSIAKAFRKG